MTHERKRSANSEDWSLADFSDMIQRQGDERRAAETRENAMLDALIEAMRAEDEFWWTHYTEAVLLVRCAIIIAMGDDAAQEATRALQRGLRALARERVMPAVRAAIRAGHVQRTDDGSST